MSLLNLTQIATYTTTYTTTTTSSGATTSTMSSTTLMMILIAVVAVVLLVLIPMLIVNWKLFTRAGKSGWISIVPFYSTYVLGDIAGKVPLAIGIIICSLLGGIPVIGAIAGTVNFALLIFLIFTGLAKKYSARTAFWVFYLLFPLVALFMIKNVTYTGGTPVAIPVQPMNPVMGGPVAPPAPQDPVVPVVPATTPVTEQSVVTPATPQPVEPTAQPAVEQTPPQPPVSPTPPSPIA